ncbi:MAG: serine hydrolase domain-containing protein [Pseudomonadota bacterium]
MIPIETNRVRGTVAPGFEPVADAFARAFENPRERGAACAIYRDGAPVVDLVGGWKDRARSDPWTPNTIALVFSLAKGMTALACAMAVTKGLFRYDDEVESVWPEFAAHGKGGWKIGALLSEQLGVAAIGMKLSHRNMGDQDALAAAIAATKPNWQPGRYNANHPHTLGWFASELIRRTDPEGRTLGRFFAEEIAEPLGADVFIGLPAAFDRKRMARIEGFGLVDLILRKKDMSWGLVLAMLMPWTLPYRALNNPLLLKGPSAMDCEEYWRLELGGAGGLGSALGFAKIYDEFARGAPTLGVDADVLTALADGWETPVAGTRDYILDTEMRYSLGLEKPTDRWPFAPTPAAYGTFAVGGSFAYADPVARTGYAWITNRLDLYVKDDPRQTAVRDAFQKCL